MSVQEKLLKQVKLFSLRDALGADPMAPQLPQSSGGNLRFNLQRKQAPSPTPTPSGAAPTRTTSTLPAGLSMRFAHAPVMEPAAPPQPAATALRAAGPAQPQLKPACRRGRARHGPWAAASAARQEVKKAASTKADVSVFGYVDELTQRLKKTQSKLDQTEMQG